MKITAVNRKIIREKGDNQITHDTEKFYTEQKL